MAQILFYEYVEDIVERRAPHREAHLARINEWRDEGKLVLAGAIGSPPHGAALLFEVEDPAEVERFAADDPYVLAGLVRERRIEPIALV
jgi:uncharacterized protein